MPENLWELIVPFWTEGYTQEQDEFFSLGYEYANIVNYIRFNPKLLSTLIHRENESRVKMACGRFHRRCEIVQCSYQDDPEQERSQLVIQPSVKVEEGG